MAKSTRRKRTVEVDFTDVEVGKGGGFHIPEGEYGMKVSSAELGVSSNDNEQIEWQFKGTEGKAKGKTFYFYTPLVEQSLWKLRETLEGLGVEVPDSPMDIELDDLEDLECIGQVEDDEYQGKTRSKLARIQSSEEDAQETTRSGKSARRGNGKAKVVKVSEEEVKEMSEDELETLVDKHGLNVDLGDYKILRKKIAAVVAALDEAGHLEA